MVMLKLATTILFCICISAQAQEPKLKGDLAAFLKSNTIYPSYSLHNCLQGTVKVNFKLNAKGEVYQASIVEGIGTDLDDEALRLIKMTSGKWDVPSTHDTTSALIVPVKFTLDGYGCDRISKADMALAIRSYQNQEELFDVISNFYKSKEKGTAKPEDEARILLIKNELGIDEEYLQERINLAMKKYNQGDRQGACEEFNFVKYMGLDKANEFLAKYCN